MCKYINKNNCNILGSICPHVYWCEKRSAWKELSSMQKCNVSNTTNVPQGYYKVRECRRGLLYVDIKGFTYEFDNPFDYVPFCVKAIEKDGVWEILVER